MGSAESGLPIASAEGSTSNCSICTSPRAKLSSAVAAGFRSVWAIAIAVEYSGQMSSSIPSASA